MQPAPSIFILNPQSAMRLFLTLIVGFLSCAAVGSSLAQGAPDTQAPAGSSAYLQDARNTILRSGTGLCWRLGEWSTADAVPGCDGALVPPVTRSTAPPIAPPPMETAVVEAPKPSCDIQAALTGEQAFAFDRATLSVSAKRYLDQEFLGKLGNCRLDAVSITGHADLLGSSVYNQRLSARRAEAVAAYLHEQGVAAAISVVGAGATQPVRECSNRLSASALRACLQPNRRVVIKSQGLQQ